MAQAAAHSTYLRWSAGNSRWTFGATSAAGALREMRAYTMAGIADRITCPTLVLDPENDQFFRGEPRRIFDALRCPKELITFSAAEGAGGALQGRRRPPDRAARLRPPRRTSPLGLAVH